MIARLLVAALAAAAAQASAQNIAVPDAADAPVVEGATKVFGAPATGKRQLVKPYGRRLGRTTTDRAVRRLGGGHGGPVSEAMTYDPRDGFESYVESLGRPDPQ